MGNQLVSEKEKTYHVKKYTINGVAERAGISAEKVMEILNMNKGCHFYITIQDEETKRQWGVEEFIYEHTDP